MRRALKRVQSAVPADVRAGVKSGRVGVVVTSLGTTIDEERTCDRCRKYGSLRESVRMPQPWLSVMCFLCDSCDALERVASR